MKVDQGDVDVSEFLRTGAVGSYRFFLTGESSATIQSKAHAAAKRSNKEVKCTAYLAVSNGLREAVHLTKVEITNPGDKLKSEGASNA